MESRSMKDKLILITYTVVLFAFLLNIQWIGYIFKYLWNIFTPFIYGGIFAFILNVLVKSLEDTLFDKMVKGKRACSIILSLLIVFSVISIMMGILVPQMKDAGKIFVDNLPEYKENLNNLGNKLGISEEILNAVDLDDFTVSKSISKYFYKHSDIAIPVILGYASSVASIIGNVVVGLIFAIYLLSFKESLCAQIKKVLKKFCKKKAYDRTLDVAALTNNKFTSYVKIQVMEACVLGLLCFIGMLIFRLPYAAPISVVIGFTALVPIIGSLVGGAVGVFLIFMINPVKALIFLIFYIILQQVETNGIYPKVVGDKVDLPSIWVLVAVTLGGTIGGVLGMLIGVPTVSVIYTLLKDYVNDKKETSK